MNNQLTCAVGIITYKRQDMLMECLKHLAAQTRLPDAIIIADASQEAEQAEEHIRNQFSKNSVSTDYIFIKTDLGSCLQRNIILDVVDKDIILFIDDDSLLDPDYIERLMELYQADNLEKVAGIDGIAREGSQITQHTQAKKSFNFRLKAHELIQWLRNRYLGSFFPKYIFKPMHDVPEKLKRFDVTAITHLYGCNMSFRVPIAKQTRFNEHLKKYSFMEDFEISYRISKDHVLLQNRDCKLRHLKHLGGRMDPSIIRYFYLVNLAYISRTALDFTPAISAYVLQHAKKYACYEYWLGFIRSSGFKQYKGALAGYEDTQKILAAPPDQVNTVYDACVEKALEKIAK
jgi:glycosyltransferase involved in cell wall biosynthesis